jgi:chemotaxis methyl-accepting protein methylase/PAS domain-containing protein
MAHPSAPEAGKPSPAKKRASKSRPAGFPIIGIGCSAGGLEALQKFFGQVSADCGMAFVVIQHLDPRHASALPELIGHSASLPVQQAKNRMKVKPNQIYVIPPGEELLLMHATLYLLEPVPAPALRLPVDVFLRSLAEDRGEGAIGVILSGMGSDGMLGLKAIKEKGGLGLAQDPGEAKFDGMPKSIIDAGLADIVAPAAALAEKIAAYLSRRLRIEPAEGASAPAALSALEKIVLLLRDRTGNDFSGYKTATLYRRIERRTALHQLDGIGAYVGYLRTNPQEVDLLFKELLIGVTGFFRDPGVWDALRDDALPALLAGYSRECTLRAWVPACSSGEEAYSLAIVFKEALDNLNPRYRFSLQIYATDIDADAIEKARRGVYPANIAADVSPERLGRFFVREEGGFRIGKEIRSMLIFAEQNILSDPPFTQLDLLCCRNLLIYFGPALQRKLIPLFHYALKPDGLLVLGTSESVGNMTELFNPLDAKSHIFRRIDQKPAIMPLEFFSPSAAKLPAGTEGKNPGRHENLEQLTDQFIQQHFAPPAVLVNGDGDILYISGRTGKYLEPAAGKVNINLHAMAREGLREALVGMIRKALSQTQPIRLQGIRVGTNGDSLRVDVAVQGLTHPEALRGRVLIVFYEVPPPPPEAKKRSKTPSSPALETELRQAREALRVAHEEMQASLEEYQSANEELQSTNEELQSANEELTTSKEELQSLNEELHSVNAELLSKVDELTGVRNDMTNLLNSTQIATVFLDNELKLRRFTQHATALFKLIPGDVGRPLSDIVNALDYPALMDDAREVLNTLVFCENQAKTYDGRWFRVRIMPYRTVDNLIDGVVITFIDISEIKELEARLRQDKG